MREAITQTLAAGISADIIQQKQPAGSGCVEADVEWHNAQWESFTFFLLQ